MEEEKKPIPWLSIAMGLLGVAVGFTAVELQHLEIITREQAILGLVVWFASWILSVAIHELGHLITGVATGYRFVSYRLGNMVLARLTVYEEGEAPKSPVVLPEEETAEENPEENPEETTSEEIPSIADTADNGFELLSEESKAAILATKQAAGVPEGEEIPLEAIEEVEEEEDPEAKFEEVYLHRKFALKKYRIPGTVGQCMLCPPSYKNPHRVPYQAYLYGGGIANLVSIPFACIFLLLFPSHWWVVAIFAVTALMTALQNLIPIKINGLPNDGYTVKMCKEDPNVHAAFVYQMRILSALNDGISVGDMPEEWFYAKFPLSERMTTNTIIANLWAFTGDRFLIHGELFQAKIIYEALANAKGLYPLLRQEGVYRFLFTMISEGRVEQTKIYPIPKDMRKSAKKLEKYFPTYSSFRYAYSKLVSERGKIMKESMASFEKMAKRYPFDGEIQDWRVLLDRLDDVIIMR